MIRWCAELAMRILTALWDLFGVPLIVVCVIALLALIVTRRGRRYGPRTTFSNFDITGD